MEGKTAILQLGTNKGNRMDNLQKAVQLLSVIVGKIGRISSVYETAPWGNTKQDDFLNVCLEVTTQMDPYLLLKACKKIERVLGRDLEAEKWTAREMDVDILFFDNQMLDEEELIIPHPFLHERSFVMVPLNELIPAFIHPKLEKNIAELSKQCPDTLTVKKHPETLDVR